METIGGPVVASTSSQHGGPSPEWVPDWRQQNAPKRHSHRMKIDMANRMLVVRVASGGEASILDVIVKRVNEWQILASRL